MQTKHIDVVIEKAASADYDARFVMSASSPDRVNDTISPKAYDPNLNKKLIALWQHDAEKPVGYWENMRVEAGKLIGDLKVASTNLGLMIKQLIADGVPLGASIGFKGKGERNEKGGIHFTAIELMECSVVSIPAHPRAMQIAKSLDMQEFIDTLSDGEDDVAASGLNGEEVLAKSRAAVLAANLTLRKVRT